MRGRADMAGTAHGAPRFLGEGAPPRLVQVGAALATGCALAAVPGSGPAILIAGAALGLPHGALDHLAGGRVFAPRFGRLWPLAFGVFYLGTAALVLLAWGAAPLATLTMFLTASALHFGGEDNSLAGRGGWAGRVAHGGLSIMVPALAHPDVVARLFTLLAGVDAAPVAAALCGPVATIWLACVAATARHLVREDRWRVPAVEAGALALLFAAAPPLIAFACYFALVHTPRALDGVVARGTSPARLVRQAAPLTLLGLALGAVLWWCEPTLAFPDRSVRIAFLLLSALTAPHMLLHWLADRKL